MNYRPSLEESRVKITNKRVKTIVGNMNKDSQILQEMTGGLPIPVIKLIKRGQREGLRGKLE